MGRKEGKKVFPNFKQAAVLMHYLMAENFYSSVLFQFCNTQSQHLCSLSWLGIPQPILEGLCEANVIIWERCKYAACTDAHVPQNFVQVIDDVHDGRKVSSVDVHYTNRDFCYVVMIQMSAVIS